MKRLEGEVLNALREFGDQQAVLLEVDPHQFLGIEINPRAAAIADLVLWIGYLQWHFRTRGKAQPAEPIIKDYKNIECRDAVLAWDSTEPLLDEAGNPVTRWDGRTTKTHPVTGEQVPDETARIPVLKYINPKKAEWPKADYVVGNPPFIGNKRMNFHLGQGYVDTLRSLYSSVPESADLVMYWWEIAAKLVTASEVKRMGLITTNSITQSFNRQIVANHIADTSDGYLVFAVPDHPWVESTDGAAVRIAMTVLANRIYDTSQPCLVSVSEELHAQNDLSNDLTLSLTKKCAGEIHADLTSGADTTKCFDLKANGKISNQGVTPLGEGFRLTRKEVEELGFNPNSLPSVIKRYSIGRDIVQRPEEKFIIDFFGLDKDTAQHTYPQLMQIIVDKVKPERDLKNRESYRKKWWIFAEARAGLRPALQSIQRYIVTCRTSKHRLFVFLEGNYLPDAKLVAIGLEDPFVLGVLSSKPHVGWAMATGGWLGVGNDSNYNHADCFNKFPFPDCPVPLKARIRELGEQLDAHRKRQQALHPKLTLTDMYNVLEKLRSGEELSAKEKKTHEEGLVSVLKQIHDDLDAAVFEAYGWPSTLSDEEILERLVALNAERHAEEERGLIRWLRPEFQKQAGGTQQGLVLEEESAEEEEAAPPKKKGTKAVPKKAAPKKAAKKAKEAWPKTRALRTKGVQSLLAEGTPLSVAEIVKRFSRADEEQIEEILEALVLLGQAHYRRGKYSA